ncbi:MAG: lipopolysaccharide heptosyltransferase II [Limnobacter sp.]|nr:lipopolysaccharide heptosyltransferase II [Limnobacter sp.]
MRILIIAPNWIGDAVMSLSLLQALHADASLNNADGSPCEIHVLAPPVTAPVYQFTPTVKSVQVEPFVHGKLQWGLRRQVGRALAIEGFDRAIMLPNSLKSALVPFFARIPQRVGYDGELRTAVLTHPLPKPSKLNKPPMIQWYGDLGGYPKHQLANPVLVVSDKQRQEVVREFGLQGEFLVLAPGAEFGPAKRWPAPHFAAVGRDYLLAHQANSGGPTRGAISSQVVLLGGPKDAEFSQQIRSLMPAGLQAQVQVLAGKTSLPQAISLMAAAKALVTNDSGLMHVGAALNVKVHAVYGSSSPHHTPPLNPSAKVHYLQLDCSPCYQRECPLGHTDCLNKLLPDQVSQALLLPQ